MELRRQFELPEQDVQYLNGLCLPWETVLDGTQGGRVIVYGFPIPAGYTAAKADLNLRIDKTYPQTQLDMVFFNPPLVRSDGRPIRATGTVQFDGKGWQQWSRHRSAANPWREDIDGVGTHLELVRNWLKEEPNK